MHKCIYLDTIYAYRKRTYGDNYCIYLRMRCPRLSADRGVEKFIIAILE